MRYDRVHSTTLLFVDGHVDFRYLDEMEVRYTTGGWSNFY